MDRQMNDERIMMKAYGMIDFIDGSGEK